MNNRWFAALILAFSRTGGLCRAGNPQERQWSSHLVVPQARSYGTARIARTTNHGGDRRCGHPRPGRDDDDGDPAPQPGRGATGGRAAGARSPTARWSAGSRSREAAPSHRPGCSLATRRRQTYDRIVAQARDPALLEFAGFNLVRSSVFPVEPGGTQAVRLTYEHLLAVNGDRVDYVLPRSESVEYTVPWKIAVKISAGTPIAAVYSPSHGCETVRPKPSVAAVELAADAGTEPGPFRLSFLRERADVSASLFAYPDPKIGGGYFLLLAGLPPQAAKAGFGGLKREVTLVIDRSGSMRGEKLAQVREAALQVLAGLDDGEAFNVILYNEGVEPFSPAAGPQVARDDQGRRPSSSKG